MMRLSTFSALAVLAPGLTFAMVSMPLSQYLTAQQTTALNDPGGYCAPTTTVGMVNQGVATAGLGLTWSQTLVQPQTAPPYGLATISCTYTPLPAATAFTGGSAQYNGMGTCVNSLTGTPYTLAYSNNPGASPPTSSMITALPANGKDNGIRITASNVAVAVNGTTICLVSGQTVFLRTSKIDEKK